MDVWFVVFVVMRGMVRDLKVLEERITYRCVDLGWPISILACSVLWDYSCWLRRVLLSQFILLLVRSFEYSSEESEILER